MAARSVRRSLVLLLAAVVWFGGTDRGHPVAARAADPARIAKAVAGPQSIPLGEIGILQAPGEAKGAAWFFWPPLTPQHAYPLADGSAVIVAHGAPGQYIAIVAYALPGPTPADPPRFIFAQHAFAFVGPGPTPPFPPDPVPTPPTPPPPTPQKIAAAIVEETSDRPKLPQAQIGAILSNQAAEYMRARGYLWRVVDKDVIGADGKPPAYLVPFLRAAEGQPLPRLVIMDTAGKVLVNAALPADEAALLEVLRQWGGKP